MVDWGGGVFAGCLPRVQLFVSTRNGRPHVALEHHIGSCRSTATSMIGQLVRFPVRRAIDHIDHRVFMAHIVSATHTGCAQPV